MGIDFATFFGFQGSPCMLYVVSRQLQRHLISGRVASPRNKFQHETRQEVLVVRGVGSLGILKDSQNVYDRLFA